MSRITVAILADIHGNMPALRAVLEDLERVRPDEVLVGGDLVGRGPEGSRVVETVRELGWRSVRGNHEDYLLAFVRREVPEAWWEEEEWAASRWMAEELSEAAIEFIRELPESLESALAPGLRLVHGSPVSNNDGLGPWSSDRQLARHLDTIDEALLVCAHTHRSMIRELRNGRVVNVGAVGLPFNRDSRAQYGLFHYEGDGWRPELRAVDYDVSELLRIYESTGFLEQGGITAELIRLEVRAAVPFLVPFLKWARLVGATPERSQVPEFLDFYDPDEPLNEFFQRLASLRG